MYMCSASESILCYVVDLVDRYTVATIDRRLSSIGYSHKQARHGLPTKDPEVERTMRGIRRAKGIAPNGKSPILTPLLRQMVAALPDDLPGLRDKAMNDRGRRPASRSTSPVVTSKPPADHMSWMLRTASTMNAGRP